ncbi:ferredoxin [Kitasatospora sp. LaBMicrA B282]|uniref:ferredoxin n=1 Tax=Kitasatospora sp. LaBMicrA B282 TaxID=3420949 RepID=UPI003D0AEC9D
MRLTADPDRCCGSGQCALTAPAVFDQSEEDGTVVLLTAEPAAEQLAAVRTALALCPTSAIRAAAG